MAGEGALGAEAVMAMVRLGATVATGRQQRRGCRSRYGGSRRRRRPCTRAAAPCGRPGGAGVVLIMRVVSDVETDRAVPGVRGVEAKDEVRRPDRRERVFLGRRLAEDGAALPEVKPQLRIRGAVGALEARGARCHASSAKPCEADAVLLLRKPSGQEPGGRRGPRSLSLGR
eukprot:614207-Prymnesium_polylepis.1